MAITLSSCNDNSGKEYRKTDNIGQITGNEFIIPPQGKWYSIDGDTSVQISDGAKLVLYFDSNNCAPCALKELEHWKNILNNVDSIRSEGIELDAMFILHAEKNNNALVKALSDHKFSHPVLFDELREFEKYNLLPQNELYNTFILDADNRVLFVGNPLANRQQWKIIQRIVKDIKTDK